MTAYSTIDLKSEVETLIDNKSRIVALYQKGKCIKVNNALCQTYSRGHYISKEYDSSFLVEPIKDNLNITRVCKNRIEYLRQYEELKYHTLDRQIFNDVYKEKEWRIKYNRQIEILEKNGYCDLLDKKSVLELNKTDLKGFIKIYDENNSNINYVLNALKKGFKTIDEYLYSIRIKKVKKTFNFNNKEAKFFIKKYVKGFYYADFNMIFKHYKDVYILANELGILKIGFPSDLRAYEQHLIELKQKNDLKSVSNRNIKAVKGIAICLKNKSLSNYKVNVLNTPRKIKEVAIEFHNCIYSTYLSKVIKGNYILGLIKKNNEDYACVGFENYKLDQLYGKFNKALPQDEYKKITRGLKLVRI